MKKGLIGRKMCVVPALAAGLTLLGSGQAAQAALTTQSGQSANALVQAILGSTGITFSNATLTGATVSSGTFSGGTGIIGFESGIILSSGNIANVVGPNTADSSSQTNGTPGDADLSVLAGGAVTRDATVLEFDFVPDNNVLSFQYVFGSEEYNEFVNSSFNDTFGFFVNGVNVALLPGTSTPVSINNVNGGNPFGTNASNPQFFRNNDPSDPGATINTGLDGLTTVLPVFVGVNAGATNHIKLAISDTSDSIFDSDVFIRANSFIDAPPNTSPVPEPGTMSLMGLGLAGLVAARRRRKEEKGCARLSQSLQELS